MNRQPQRIQTPMVGGSSLLVIFAVLCLTVFALLGCSTVQADGRLADSTVQAVSDYYAADCQAEKILAKLRLGEIPEGVRTVDDVYYYTCSISENRELRVAVRLQENDWEILCWQAVSTVQWDDDKVLSVWDGET